MTTNASVEIDNVSLVNESDYNVVKDLVEQLNLYLDWDQIQYILKAYRFAAEAHKHQKRRSGERE